MILYHGTSESRWKAILATGSIQPHSMHGTTNVKEFCQSHPDMVYLSECYAPHYSTRSVIEVGERLAIIEVRVNEQNLVPDEDALVPLLELRTKLAQVRDTIINRHWTESFNLTGNCAHRGPIPLSNVLRVAITHQHWEPLLPITPEKYSQHGDQHRALTDRLFKEAPIVLNLQKE